MIERAPGGFIILGTDEINVKEIFPRLALQRAGFDFGQVNIAQCENAQSLEQCAWNIFKREYDGSLRFALRDS